MAAIKFPFIECHLNLIFRWLSDLDWGINIESLLLRYLSIAAPRAISISDLEALNVRKRGFIKAGRTAGCGQGLPRRSYTCLWKEM